MFGLTPSQASNSNPVAQQMPFGLAPANVQSVPPRGQSSEGTDQVRVSSNNSLTQLMRAAGGERIASPSSKLGSAVEKLKAGIELFFAAAAGNLSSDAMQLFFEKSQQSSEQVYQTKDDIRDHFKDLEHKTELKLKEIQKRIDAQNGSGFFAGLMNVFKGIATVLSVASAAFTGGAGLAAAAMMIGSFIVSQCDLGDAGKWISLGLGLGAGGMGLASAATTLTGGITNAATTATEKIGTLATQVGAAVAQGGAAASSIAKSSHDSSALEAAANIQEIKAAAQKTMQDEEAERELLRETLEATHKGFMQIVGIVSAEHAKNSVALAPNKG